MSEGMLPIGEAEALGNIAKENPENRLAIFSQVENKVIMVNPEVNIHLQLEVGKPSPLGLFAEASLANLTGEIPDGKQKGEVWHEHNRTAVLSRVIFSDSDGRLYRDIDLKGIGYVSAPEYSKAKVSVIDPNSEFGLGRKLESGSRIGLLDRDVALYDYQTTEDFVQAGIRTSRTLAIIEIEEIVYSETTDSTTVNPRKATLEEARKLGIIDKNFHPVIEVRGFGTKARLNDILRPSKNYEDAKKMVSQELGSSETMSDEEYYEWFGKTLGSNVALMHKNGWAHHYLTAHNITLDCRIVDLDSVSDLTSEKQREEEVRAALDTMTASFSQRVGANIENIAKNFSESYDATFTPAERAAYFKKPWQFWKKAA